MHKKLLLLIPILFSIQTAHAMVQRDNEQQIKYIQSCFLKSANKKKEAMITMNIISEEPFYQAKFLLEAIDNNKLTTIQSYCSSNQQQIINLLLLPDEDSDKIINTLCENHKEMKKAFCSKPLKEALEWLALMHKKHKKEKESFADVISFPELYCCSSPTIVTELTAMMKHFRKNPTIPYQIGFQQEMALTNLPHSITNNSYFADKKILPIFTTYKKAIVMIYKNVGIPIYAPPITLGCALICLHFVEEGSVPAIEIIKEVITTSAVFSLVISATGYLMINFVPNYLRSDLYTTIDQLGIQ